MRRHLRRALGTSAVVGVALALSIPAAAQTSGAETLSGKIVASGLSGTRVVLATVVVAHGVFNGAGRVVEIDNLPGDPDNVSRDDLVFPGGTMHLVTTTLDFAASVDPRSCRVSVRLDQTQTIDGGSGRFAFATGSFSGVLTGSGLASRNPDGSCSEEAFVIEVAAFTLSGTLSF